MGQLFCCNDNYQVISDINNDNNKNSIKKNTNNLQNYLHTINNFPVSCDMIESSLNYLFKNNFKNNFENHFKNHFENKFLKLNHFILSEEIILQILNFLTLNEIILLSAINKSFYNYWTNHLQIWNKFFTMENKYFNKYTICYCNEMNYFTEFYKFIYLPNKYLNNYFTILKQPIKKDYNYTFKILILGDKEVGKSTYLSTFYENIYKNDYNNYIQTIGVDFKHISLQYNNNFTHICDNHNNNCNNHNCDNNSDVVMLRFWDVGGDKRFETITNSFYKGSNGLIVCFDLTNITTFHRVEHVIKKFIRHNHICPISDNNNFNEQNDEKNIKNLNSKLKSNGSVFAISIVGLKSDCFVERNIELDELISNLLKKLVGNDDKEEGYSCCYKDLFIQYFEVSSKMGMNVNAPIYFLAKKLYENSYNNSYNYDKYAGAKPNDYNW